MKALHGFFNGGTVTFPFNYPEYDGPVVVMVVFPDSSEFDNNPWEDPWEEAAADPLEEEWAEERFSRKVEAEIFEIPP